MKKFTKEQMIWLSECQDIIYKYYTKGNGHVYQWNLQRELNYIDKLVKVEEYDSHYETDRLNSYRDLIRYIRLDNDIADNV